MDGVTPRHSPQQLMATARKFEAQSLNALLQPIFATVDPSKGKFGGGAGEAAFRPMLIERYAEGIARSGGIGLANAVFREMLRLQEGATGATARMAAETTQTSASTTTPPARPRPHKE